MQIPNGLLFSKRYLSVIAVWVLASLCFSVQVFAQAPPAPCSGIGAGASDALLQLSLKDTRAVFHQGEIITLQLAFTSKSKGKYHMDTRTSGQNGRVTRESFCLDPVAGSDPLADYFGAGTFSLDETRVAQPPSAVFQTQTPSAGNTILKRHPFRLDLDLNEWKSLPSGTYHLVLETQRISQVTPTGEQVPVLVRSNAIQFQVMDADPSWQEAQLTAAITALDTGASEEARHAARVLRFLGTEAATHELVNRYWSLNRQLNGWNLMFGLVGSPHRDMAIQEMRNAISDPQHPITRDFLRTLALLEAASDPQFKAASNAAQTSDEFMQAQQQESAVIDKLVNQHLAELSSVAPQKTGNALKVSMETLNQGRNMAALQ